jgi:ATP-dependent protease HslVU (ClpYQ) peptidase subunit
MTCIVGIESDGKVYIGGDSAGVAGYSLTIRSDAKVFTKLGFEANTYTPVGWIMGFTSSFRMGQLLRYKLELPKVPATADTLEEFMATAFVDAARAALSAGGWLSKDKDRESGGMFLVGVRGELFCVQSDFQVARAADGYDAVGCGDELALGSLYSTIGKTGVEDRLLTALRAAEHHSAGVAGPFTIVETE